jgi:hypothetical protein
MRWGSAAALPDDSRTEQKAQTPARRGLTGHDAAPVDHDWSAGTDDDEACADNDNDCGSGCHGDAQYGALMTETDDDAEHDAP